MPAKKTEPMGSASVLHTVEQLSVSRSTSTRWVLIGRSYLWHPPTDLYETDTTYVIQVEIAGMRGGDFNVSVSSRRVTISGVRPIPSEARAYHQMEINNGEFRTEINIPGPFEREKIEASYSDGNLKLVLPKPAARQIDVT
jgi:HSP20 family protein